MSVSGSGPVVHALVHKANGVNSIQDRFFFALFVTCPDEKIGFQCTNKVCRKKMNAHRLPIPM